MNPSTPCQTALDQLAALDEGLLSPTEAADVTAHLEHCAACAAEREAARAMRERLELAGSDFRARAIGDAVMNRIETRITASPPRRHRRFTMPRPARYVAAIAASAAILSTGFILWPSGPAPGVAFAGVISKAREATSLRFRISHQVGEQSQHEWVLMMHDSRMRKEEDAGARILVGDMATGESIHLFPRTRTCVVGRRDDPHDINPYHLFLELADNISEDLGIGVYEGRAVHIFRAPVPEVMKDLHRSAVLTVWADLATSLPVRIEVEQVEPDSQEPDGVKLVVDQMQFGGLDESLFSLEPPAGYRVVPYEVMPEVGGVYMQGDVRKMLMACMIYEQEHGRWPGALTELERYGISAEMLACPRRPDLAVGYSYLKPGPGTTPQEAVIFDTLRAWEGWAVVGYLDGRVELITDREAYIKLMGRSEQLAAPAGK